MSSMAVSLGRAPSNISREIKRNGSQQGYRASEADEAAWDRARRPKSCKLARNRPLARIVAERLQLEWSPEQIAGLSSANIRAVLISVDVTLNQAPLGANKYS